MTKASAIFAVSQCTICWEHRFIQVQFQKPTLKIALEELNGLVWAYEDKNCILWQYLENQTIFGMFFRQIEIE
jgi:hypothetical protein